MTSAWVFELCVWHNGNFGFVTAQPCDCWIWQTIKSELCCLLAKIPTQVAWSKVATLVTEKWPKCTLCDIALIMWLKQFLDQQLGCGRDCEFDTSLWHLSCERLPAVDQNPDFACGHLWRRGILLFFPWVLKHYFVEISAAHPSDFNFTNLDLKERKKEIFGTWEHLWTRVIVFSYITIFTAPNKLFASFELDTFYSNPK